MPQQSNHFRQAAVGSSVKAAPAAWYSCPELLAGAGLIALATSLVYLPSVGGGFILDDYRLVTENQLVNSPDGLYRIWFTTEPIDYWPLTNTSFWIEWRLWGMNPTGYHVTNLILHILDSLLLWAILRTLSIPGAWLAALLFAVHPVNVESVAWISQRKNVLSMLFFLLSILWYLKADRGAGLRLRRERSVERRWYALSLLAFILAMLSKGSVAILPVVLLLLAWWQQGTINRADFVRTIPFFVVAIVLTAVNIWFQTHGSERAIRDVTLLQRLLGAGGVVWFYLYKALVPVNLSFVYPQWDIDVHDWRWWAPLVAAAVVTAVLLWQRHSRCGRPLLFAWLFFGVALLPVMGFTDVGFMRFSLVADHYQHIAIMGAVALVAAGISLFYEGLRAPVRSAGIVGAFVVAVVMALLTWKQSHLYSDAIVLYKATLADHPDSYVAQYNLALSLAESHQLPEAIDQFEKSLRMQPDSPETHYNLGVALAMTGRLPEAVEHFQEALRLRPDYRQCHADLARAYAQLNRPEEAIATAQKALDLARSADKTEVAQQIESWIASYRAKLKDRQQTVPQPEPISPSTRPFSQN